MEALIIKKSIEIDAPKDKIWEILLQDQYNRIWFAEFSPGAFAETNWQEGSKVTFKDESGSGIIGTIVANQIGKLLSIEYHGIVKANIEDYESEEAQEVKGGREIYRLVEKNNATQLEIEVDMGEEMYEMMATAWDKALHKIKELAEA
ncbi:SRPBCC family protein [Adhaeribacter radiodurans]|uniref:SRPBCC domain-containing protein n=1 Tax=Adhaeribacter radiodurans TaxID=2745197 RepID=A0A7L7L8G0_9BACT|nr:SRPBCC domain-containing protein [Adhaeribacter radiodurans]QMU29014.1 SRPBCC domain-containing protein [Adhaeribacter radiodurans]